ncbi:CBS domain-containing protein [Oxalobacteraceae bacterium R-40]|uniref:CBS domain-containing protein n=2 Tax=Keguizhuia sedimenti TaxID=3064264 RepID=A0ABU1BJI7_9BURK|nr:CBS domain-containing protein [Oxalobacteraceae bacterium R-40]
MKTVADILKDKPYSLFTIAPDAKVYEAIVLMAEKSIGALPVVEEGEVIGMLTERDYARKIALHGLSSKTTLVRAVMTSPVLYVQLTQSIEDCMILMTGIRSRHLPVMDNGKLVGLVSIGDIVKALVSGNTLPLQELERHLAAQNRQFQVELVGQAG